MVPGRSGGGTARRMAGERKRAGRVGHPLHRARARLVHRRFDRRERHAPRQLQRRADPVSDPTSLQFFNTAAYSLPRTGTYGTAGRNTIVGPGTSVLNLGIMRNIPFGQNRVLTLQLVANNVLNTVQWASIDTVVNSPTFGQVTAVRPMRRVQIVTRFRF